MALAERWQRVAELFEEAVTLEPEARAPFLERACDGDADLASEVLALLAADAGASRLFSGLRRELAERARRRRRRRLHRPGARRLYP